MTCTFFTGMMYHDIKASGVELPRSLYPHQTWQASPRKAIRDDAKNPLVPSNAKSEGLYIHTKQMLLRKQALEKPSEMMPKNPLVPEECEFRRPLYIHTKQIAYSEAKPAPKKKRCQRCQTNYFFPTPPSPSSSSSSSPISTPNPLVPRICMHACESLKGLYRYPSFSNPQNKTKQTDVFTVSPPPRKKKTVGEAAEYVSQPRI